jgi:hypothetical protein
MGAARGPPPEATRREEKGAQLRWPVPRGSEGEREERKCVRLREEDELDFASIIYHGNMI